MKSILFLSTLAGLAACQSTQSDDATEVRTVDPVILLSPLQEPEVDPELPVREWMGEHELAIWSSPGFQRRFAESYIALGEIEPELTLEEAQVMIEIGDAMGAEQEAKAVELLEANIGPDSSALFDYNLANIYFQQERIEDAIAAFHSALAKFPRFQRAWNNLGLVSVLSGNYGEAKSALSRVIEMGGGTVDTYGLLAYAHLQTEDHLAAESAYRMANLLDPTNNDWKMGLAESLFRQGRYDATASLCDNMIAGNPENANLWKLQARAFLSMQKPMEAAQNFEFLDKMGAGDWSTLNLLGDIYTSEGVFDEAAVAYSRAIEVDPTGDPLRSIQAARGLASRGAVDPTRRVVKAISAHMPIEGNLDLEKGLLELQARMARTELDGDKVTEALKGILELDPLDGEALVQLGQHYRSEGEIELAMLQFERASELEDYAAQGKRMHGQLLVSEGRYTEALPLLKEVQLLDPTPGIAEYIQEVERRARQ